MPTALELTHAQWQPYIEAARQRPAPPAPTLAEQQQRAQLLARVRQVAAELNSRYKVKRVLLFGSLASADWFIPESDVDLAVEGLAVADYWQAWRLVEEIMSIDRWISLRSRRRRIRSGGLYFDMEWNCE